MGKVVKTHSGNNLLAQLAGMNAMNKEIRRQVAEHDRNNEINIDALMLWQLHTQLGFGRKRLKRFYDNFEQEFKDMCDRYEVGKFNQTDTCRELLLGIGVDINKWDEEKRGLKNDK